MRPMPLGRARDPRPATTHPRTGTTPSDENTPHTGATALGRGHPLHRGQRLSDRDHAFGREPRPRTGTAPAHEDGGPAPATVTATRALGAGAAVTVAPCVRGAMAHHRPKPSRRSTPRAPDAPRRRADPAPGRVTAQLLCRDSPPQSQTPLLRAPAARARTGPSRDTPPGRPCCAPPPPQPLPAKARHPRNRPPQPPRDRTPPKHITRGVDLHQASPRERTRPSAPPPRPHLADVRHPRAGFRRGALLRRTGT